jgi:hypothetical protein
MGRKRKGPSLLGIFKDYIAANPQWLKTRSNDEAMAKFAAEHPELPVDKRVKQAMFNAKNYMKKGHVGRRGRRARVAEINAAMASSAPKTSALQLLENHVDESLAMARTIGKESLGKIIDHLHRARNMLVLMIES